jgi:hypothetical protein
MQTQSLFNTVPVKKYLPFDGRGNKLDYSKVIEAMDLKNVEVAAAANVPLKSVRYDDKIPDDLRERIVEWANLLQLVAEHFKDTEKTLLWFRMPNPLLGNVSPRDMIRYGRYKKLLKFVYEALAQNKD